MRCKVHKYRRYRNNSGEDKTPVYRCVNCPHYVTGTLNVLNRESLCWICGKTFKMTERSLQLKPHCGCKNRRSDVGEQIKEDLLSQLLRKIG